MKSRLRGLFYWLWLAEVFFSLGEKWNDYLLGHKHSFCFGITLKQSWTLEKKLWVWLKPHWKPVTVCIFWLQARGKKRQKGWFPATHVKVLESSSGKSTPAPQPGNADTHRHHFKSLGEGKSQSSMHFTALIKYQRGLGKNNNLTVLFIFSLPGDRHIWLHSRQWGRDELL